MARLHEEDARFIRRCLEGDINAFEPLVRRYQHAAFATALSFLHNRQEAEDLMQDAFITAYSRLSQLRDPATFAAWLRQIVQNACRNRLRRRHVQKRHLETAGNAQQITTAAQIRHREDTQKDDLWHAVRKLPPIYRDVTLMHYLSGLPYAAIADYMGISVTTIKGRLHQARLRLKDMLTEPLEYVESITEDIAMPEYDFIGKIQDKTCRVGSVKFQETVCLDGMDHIVIHLGVTTDVTVTHTDGDDMVLEGVKSSLGFSEEEAKEKAACIEILSDRVDNYEEVGPHESMLPNGMTVDEDGYHLQTASSDEYWRHINDKERSWHQDDLPLEDIHPVFKERPLRLPEALRVNHPAVRLSVLQKTPQSLTFLNRDYTDEVKAVFQPYSANDNWSDDQPSTTFGPVGHVEMTVRVPAGKILTIIRGRQVRIVDYRASVRVIQGDEVSLSNVEGDVHLQECMLSSAVKVRGSFKQRFDYRGSRSLNHTNDRYTMWRDMHLSCTLEDVQGDIDIDIGGPIDIEASKLAGSVRIKNLYGTTRLYQNTFKTGSRYRLSSHSGEIVLYLKERLIDKVNYTLQTICGKVEFVGPDGLEWSDYRIYPLLAVSTMRSEKGWSETQQADFVVQTESGDITVEKMK